MCIRDRSIVAKANRSGFLYKIGSSILVNSAEGVGGLSSSSHGVDLPSPIKMFPDITAYPSIDPRRFGTVSYTHLRAHETPEHLVCRLLLEKKKKKRNKNQNGISNRVTMNYNTTPKRIDNT